EVRELEVDAADQHVRAGARRLQPRPVRLHRLRDLDVLVDREVGAHPRRLGRPGRPLHAEDGGDRRVPGRALERLDPVAGPDRPELRDAGDLLVAALEALPAAAHRYGAFGAFAFEYAAVTASPTFHASASSGSARYCA